MRGFFFFQQFCFAFFLESITWIVSCGKQSWSWPLQKSAKPSTAPVGLVLLIALYVHGQWFPSTALDASYFLRPCIHPATCSSVSFLLWHGDACPCDSEGGETVTHTNASRQLCVSLLAVSCVLGHSNIGSCPFRFLSLELGEDLTLCLPDTETSCTPGPLSGPRTRKTKRYHQWKVMKNIPSITQSWSLWHNWWLM